MNLQQKAVHGKLIAPGLRPVSVVRARFRPSAKATASAPASVQHQQDVKTATPPYRATDGTIKDILSLYRSMLHEYDYKVPESWIEGKIPEDLYGTYFRNGPGMQVNNPRYKRHTFDGDGMILSFGFKDGQVRFTNKYVRTKGFLDEQAAGRPVHRTAFTRGAADGSLLFNPFDFQLKNVANTGVLHWGGKLLALYETGLPHQVDPATLDTVGETNLNGQLLTPVLAAHYRVMPGQQQLGQQQIWRLKDGSNVHSNGHSNGNGNGKSAGAGGRSWVGFSFNTRIGDAELLFYEFAEDGNLAVAPESYKLPGTSLAMIHDIAVTDDYYVAVVGPVNFNPGKFVTQYFTSQCSIAECLMYDPSQPTKVHLIPRPRGAAAGTKPYIIDAPPMFTFHHANAFQVPAQSPYSTNSNGNGTTNTNGTTHVNGTTANGNGTSSMRQQLILDTVAWDNVAFEANQYNLTPEYYTGGNRAQLRRFVFELDPPKALSSDSSSAGRLVANHQLARRCMEFPSVNWDVHGRPHQHIYCSSDTVDHEVYWGPTQAVMKISLPDPLAGTQGPVSQADLKLNIWDSGERSMVMEPLFVQRPNPKAEDDGWVLATIYNAETGNGELVILDAQKISEGPVAHIRLQHFLGAGLHGSFTPEVWGDFGGEGLNAQPAWKEPNVVRAV